MTAVLLVVALLAFVAIGLGVSLLRANARPPLAGNWQTIIRAWFATLQARRAVGAALIAAGALVLLAVLVFRP